MILVVLDSLYGFKNFYETFLQKNLYYKAFK